MTLYATSMIPDCLCDCHHTKAMQEGGWGINQESDLVMPSAIQKNCDE